MKFLFLLSFFIGSGAFAAQSYNCSYFNQFDWGATSTSTKILSKNALRRCLVFQNHAASGTSTVLIKFGSAHTGTEGFALPGNSTIWEPINVPTGSIYFKANPAAGFSTTILEGM